MLSRTARSGSRGGALGEGVAQVGPTEVGGDVLEPGATHRGSLPLRVASVLAGDERRTGGGYVAEQLRDAAEADPHGPAIIDEFAELTRSELNARVNRLGNRLRAPR